MLEMTGHKKWIGIDGGGTKTSCVIGDEKGNLLAFAIGTSSNIHSIPAKEVLNTLEKVINQVLKESRSSIGEVEAIYLCLAGADRERDKSIIKSLFENTVYEHKIIIKNDADAALAAGTWGESGLLLIAGTGSIAYGVTSDFSKNIRVGGWGYLFGDEGSGFFIGKKAVQSVLKSYDTREPKTLLTDLILEHFHFTDATQLLSLYGTEHFVAKIAELSKYVFQAAKKQDAAAKEIMEVAIEELVFMAETVYKKIDNNINPLLVLHGGLFSNNDFKNSFKLKLRTVLNEDLKIISPDIPAVVGAYLLALKTSGCLIDNEIKKKVLVTWEEINKIKE
ncbi:BadF/BadG/BcrA/BcrD ATPase family protein [Lysinibacillus fusiformis]|nr:BadF/BadG/BcrA/BcrD ATPase family protein [Lysinibacillus fusiformis]